MSHKHKADRQRQHTPSVSGEDAAELKPDSQKRDAHHELNYRQRFFKTWTWETSIQLGIFIVGAFYTYVTWGLWRNAENTLAGANRAWIEIRIEHEEFDRPLAAMTEWDLRATLVNRGHSPARNISFESYIEVLPAHQAPALTYNGPHRTYATGILFPDAKSDVNIRATPRNVLNAAPITSDQRIDLETGRQYYVAYARVSYVDDFGKHWTHRCGWHYFAPGSFNARSCVAYDAVGDGEDPTEQGQSKDQP